MMSKLIICPLITLTALSVVMAINITYSEVVPLKNADHKRNNQLTNWHDILKSFKDIHKEDLEKFVENQTSYYMPSMKIQPTMTKNKSKISKMNYFVNKKNGKTKRTNSISSNWMESEMVRNEKAREKVFSIATPKETPYAVLLFTFNNKWERLGSSCSGSLLTRQWILTSAYCLINRDTGKKAHSVTIYAGGNSEQEFVELKFPDGYQILNSSQVIFYPNYIFKKAYDVTLANIGLVKAEGKFLLSSTVNVVKLSSKPWNFHNATTCQITGFGKVYKYFQSPMDYLRKTYYLKVETPCFCSKQLQKEVNNSKEETWICSQLNMYQGICEGDFGAGLVCDGEIKGVTSPFVTIKDVKSCSLQIADDLECGMNNTLNVFEVTHPYGKWINLHVPLYQFVPSKSCRNLPSFILFSWLFCPLILSRTCK